MKQTAQIKLRYARYIAEFSNWCVKVLKKTAQPGVKKDFSKAKTGELKTSPKRLEENQTSKYNSSDLAAALLKYKEV